MLSHLDHHIITCYVHVWQNYDSNNYSSFNIFADQNSMMFVLLHCPLQCKLENTYLFLLLYMLRIPSIICTYFLVKELWFFGPCPVLVWRDQKVLPVLVLGQKSATRFCPTHPVLVWPGLAVAVTEGSFYANHFFIPKGKILHQTCH